MKRSRLRGNLPSVISPEVALVDTGHDSLSLCEVFFLLTSRMESITLVPAALGVEVERRVHPALQGNNSGGSWWLFLSMRLAWCPFYHSALLQERAGRSAHIPAQSPLARGPIDVALGMESLTGSCFLGPGSCFVPCSCHWVWGFFAFWSLVEHPLVFLSLSMWLFNYLCDYFINSCLSLDSAHSERPEPTSVITPAFNTEFSTELKIVAITVCNQYICLCTC